MGHTLYGVGLTVGPVVGGVDAPRSGGRVMGLVADAVHDGVTKPHVLRLHVDLGAQTAGAVGELAVAHPLEQIEGFRCGTVAVGALDARLAVAALLLANRLGGLVVDVGQVLADEVLGPLVQLVEVVGGVDDVGGGVPEPLDVLDDRLDVLNLLGARVGVVQTQVADAAEVLRDAEVSDDGLGVANVQVAIGLGWESGLDPSSIGALLVVRANDLMNEVRAGLGRGSNGFCHGGNLTGVCRYFPIDSEAS